MYFLYKVYSYSLSKVCSCEISHVAITKLINEKYFFLLKKEKCFSSGMVREVRVYGVDKENNHPYFEENMTHLDLKNLI